MLAHRRHGFSPATQEEDSVSLYVIYLYIYIYIGSQEPERESNASTYIHIYINIHIRLYICIHIYIYDVCRLLPIACRSKSSWGCAQVGWYLHREVEKDPYSLGGGRTARRAWGPWDMRCTHYEHVSLSQAKHVSS